MRLYILLASTASFFLPLSALAGMGLDLSRVEDLRLRETIQKSFNFNSWNEVRTNGAEDQQRELLRLTRLLQALGYLDAQVQKIEDADNLWLLPIPGHLYSLGYISVEGMSRLRSEEFQAQVRVQTERYVGRIARSDTFSDIGRSINRVLEENGYPRPSLSEVELRKLPLAHMVGLHSRVEAGEKARFGDIIFDDVEAAKELGPANKFSGQAYHPAVIEAMKEEISRTNRFKRITLSVQPRLDEPQVVDIRATLQRKNKAEEDLANHGRAGLGLLVLCGTMLAIRQMSLPFLPPRRSKFPASAETLISLALLLAAVFSVERLIFLIG